MNGCEIPPISSIFPPNDPYGPLEEELYLDPSIIVHETVPPPPYIEGPSLVEGSFGDNPCFVDIDGGNFSRGNLSNNLSLDNQYFPTAERQRRPVCPSNRNNPEVEPDFEEDFEDLDSELDFDQDSSNDADTTQIDGGTKPGIHLLAHATNETPLKRLGKGKAKKGGSLKDKKKRGKGRAGRSKTDESDGSGNSFKSRRRLPTQAQRRAANVRERKRMYHLNSAFDELRTRIPRFAYEKHLSRIETLRLAIGYIRFMKEVLRAPIAEVYSRYANAAQEMQAKWAIIID